jgi:hypothetical protein
MPRAGIIARVLAFGLVVILIVGEFVAADIQAAHDFPGGPTQCFSVGVPSSRATSTGSTTTLGTGRLSATDGLYFAVGVLTTAGTGGIQPISPTCRAMVLSQNVIGALVILVGVAGLLTRVLQNPVFGSR